MAYLIDTCVVSEPTRKVPNGAVVNLLNALTPRDAYVSSVTLGEIWKGIQLLAASKKRTDIEEWFKSDLLIKFDGRVLPFDQRASRHWGELAAKMIRAGKTMGILDSQIASIAMVNDLTVITRNESDFQYCGVRILNPWK